MFLIKNNITFLVKNVQAKGFMVFKLSEHLYEFIIMHL